MAVELKKGQKVNLKKKTPIGEILINLNWDQPKKRFLFAPKSIDLDLGCLYQLKNGRKGAVQALGGNVMTDAFGLVALVAMMPLITVQIMGVVYVLSSRRKAVARQVPEYGNNEVIELWEM